LTLKNAGYYKSAIAQFEQAAADSTYALRAYAQIGLCNKAVGRLDEAVAAFRKALPLAGHSKQDTVQLLYVLGRTLETLGRMTETLEAYRWIRREDPGYRDVAVRIERLSARRPSSVAGKSVLEASSEHGAALKSLPDS
jgi:tetratricopeptide (TPR) repeat protein